MKEGTSAQLSGRGELHGGARVTTLVTLRKCTLGNKREIKTLKFVSASTKGFKGGLAWIKPSKKDMAVTFSYYVFDGSAQNVISISSYIETVGSYSTRPLSKGLYRPSDDDGVLTCVNSLFICGLCWNPPQNQLNFGKFPVPSIGCLYILRL